MPEDSSSPKQSFSQKNPKTYKTILFILGVVKWTFVLGIISMFLVGGIGFGYVSSLVKDDPVRTTDFILEKMNENDLTGFVYFNDGTQVGQLRSDEDRRIIGTGELPDTVRNAVIAIEDYRFYEHSGIDFKGTFRAVTQKLTNADVQTGGSTITQQLARRVFLSLDKSDNRKAKEIFLSLRLERLMSKEQILLAYLNKIPFGNGSNGTNLSGIKAAAKGIFNVDDLNQLNVAQAAYLAGLPQSPSTYSAFTSKGKFDKTGFDKANTRKELVLKRMLETGYLTQSQYEEALKFDVQASLAPTSEKAYDTYPYLMLEAERQASEILLTLNNPNVKKGTTKTEQDAYNEAAKESREQLLRSGYRIYTTIDKTIYDQMHVISEEPKNFTPDDPTKGVEQIAGIMIDNKTGAILGMIEGRNFFIEQMNLATQMKRQPGSTMKPIAAYAPALEKGAIQPATVIDDVPIVLKDWVKKWHLPENWDNDFHGLVTARTALNWSYNIPAIKLFLNQVGIDTAWDYAKRMGINSITKEDYNAQTGVIGGLSEGVSVEEMTNAYTTLANKGVFNDAFMISKITDADGKVVYEHQQKPTTVFSEETAYLMTDMMRTVITAGTGTDIMKDYKYFKTNPVVGKTGSTQNDGDAWFVGYTPDITVGVWAGYDTPKLTLKKTGCNTTTELGCGTQRAKKIFSKVMNATVENKPELFVTKQFERPANIVDMTVSGYSGKLPNEETVKAGKLNTDIFNKKWVPTEEDNVLVHQKFVAYDGKVYLPKPETPADMVQEKLVVRREKSISSIISEIEGILPQLPEENRPDISHYYPLDYQNDSASVVDPRSDDGQRPAAPGGVALHRLGDGSFEIVFSPAANPDLVGYRLYRTSDSNGFQRLNGKVALIGQEARIVDKPPTQGLVGYYVTAVDVVGKESPPSRVVYSDGNSGDIVPIDSMGIPTGNGSGASGGNGAGGTPTPPPGQSAKGAPSAPRSLALKPTNAGLEISWAANAASEGVKRYDIYYSDKENGKYTKLQSSTTTKVNYYAIVYDGWYRVTATNNNGESAPSKAVQYKK